MPREGKKSSFGFGYLLTLILMLLLVGSAVVLLIPSWHILRKKQQEETEKTRELDARRNQRNEKMREINDLRTSKEATEKVSREKFNQVGKDEIVIKYTVPDRERDK